VNTCTTKLKSQQQQHIFIKIDSYKDFEYLDNNSVFIDLFSAERTNIVNTVLDLLKPEESLLLRLYYLAEMDIKEIMEITGFKDSKIKVTLHRARKSFYMEFQKMFRNEKMMM